MVIYAFVFVHLDFPLMDVHEWMVNSTNKTPKFCIHELSRPLSFTYSVTFVDHNSWSSVVHEH
jgi:hypothetical protein